MNTKTKCSKVFLLSFFIILLCLPLKLFAASYPDWYTPVMVAICEDDPDSLAPLLTGKTSPGSGINPDATIKQTLLDYAVEQKAYKCLKLLAQKAGKEINTYIYYPIGNSSWARTPLVYAASEGDLKAVQILVENGKNINLDLRSWHEPVSDLGREPNSTALHYACDGGFYEIVDYLLSKGSGKNLKNYYGDTPLFSAIKAYGSDSKQEQKNNCTKTVEILLKYKVEADIDELPDKVRWTSLPEGANPKLPKQIPVLGGWNKPIHFAAMHGFTKAIEMLTAYGIDINCQVENYLYSPLMLAAQSDQAETVKYIMSHGGKAELEDITGSTAILYACMVCGTKTVETLLKGKSNVNTINSAGQTCLSIASNLGNQYKDKDVLNIMKLLIKNGADVNLKSDVGFACPALFWACGYGAGSKQTDRAKLLLSNKADPNLTGKDGYTALMCAASKGYIDLAKLLVNYGADVNAKDKNGRTAMMVAAEATNPIGFNSGFSSIIELLINKGANVNEMDKDKKTALSYARQSNNSKCVAILEKNGGKVSQNEKKIDYASLLTGTWTTENATFKSTYTFNKDQSWTLVSDVSSQLLKQYPKEQHEQIRSAMLMAINMQGTKGKYTVKGSSIELNSMKVLGIEFKDGTLYLNGERYTKIK